MDKLLKLLIPSLLIWGFIDCSVPEIVEDDLMSFETSSDDDFSAISLTLSTNAIFFKVKAKEEAQIILSKIPGNFVENYILIILGKDGNMNSSIERKGEEPTTIETPEILSDAEERSFWIFLKPMKISFGKGENLGSEQLGIIHESGSIISVSFATGNSVTGRWTLRQHTGHDVFRYTPMNLNYNRLWMTSYEKKHVVYTVKAGSEARLILSNEMYNTEGEDSHYEIILGTIGNSKSMIRKMTGEYPPTPPLVEAETPQLMKFSEYLTFWARWDFGVLEVGKGPQVGLQPIMRYAETDQLAKIKNITAFGITTSSGHEGHWKISNFGLNNFLVTQNYNQSAPVWIYAKSKTFEFYVRSCSSANVYISREAFDLTEGLHGNGYSIEFDNHKKGLGIRKYPTSKLVAELDVDGGILDCYIKKKFWISWTEHTVKIGMGELFQNELLSFREPNHEDIESLKTITLEAESSTDDGYFEFSKDSGPDIFVQSGKRMMKDKTWLDVTGMSQMTFKVQSCEGIVLPLANMFRETFVDVIVGDLEQPWNKIVDMQGNILTQSDEVVALCGMGDWLWLSWTSNEFALGAGPVVGHSVVLHWKDPSSDLSAIAFTSITELVVFEFTTFPTHVYEVNVEPIGQKDTVGLSVYQSHFSFQVKGCKGAVLLLKETPTSEVTDLFWVIIGDLDNNTKVRVFHGSDPNNGAVAEEEGLLDCNQHHLFWVEWKPNGMGLNVTFGKGEYGENQLLELPYHGNQVEINDIQLLSSVNETDWIFSDDSAMVSSFYTKPEFDINQIIRRVAGVSTFIFKVKASAEAHVVLSASYNPEEYYDIVIGGESNNWTRIYKYSREREPFYKEIFTPGILSSEQFLEFWVTWYGGVIQVGRGSIAGAFPILVLEDSRTLAVAFLALSTGDGYEGHWQIHTLLDGTFIITTTPETSPDALSMELLPDLQYYGFTVRACDSASVLLLDQGRASDIVYQIDIGIEDNTVTRITNSSGIVVAEETTPNLLSCGSLKTFYLRWDNGLLQLLNGDMKGKMVIEHLTGDRSDDIHGITFGSQCHKPVDWIVSELEDRLFEFNTSNALQTNDYSSVWLDVHGRSVITFSVKACTYASILLTSVPGQLDKDLAYEVVLGTETSRNEIRKGIDGEVVAFDDKNPDLLDCNEYRTFSVVRKAPKHISIATATEKDMQRFLELYSDTEITIGAMTVATQDPSGASWKLGENPSGPKYHATTPNNYKYGKVVVVPEQLEFSFSIKACENAKLLLQQNPFEKDEAEEIALAVVIGGSNHTQSFIFNYLTGEVLASHDHNPLACEESREFWVSWKDNSYNVGSGPYVGQNTFLSHTPSSKYRPFASVSMTTGSQSGAEWSWPRENEKLVWLGHESSSQEERSYHWVDTFGHQQVVFRVRACEDASVLLHDLSSEALEIRIGMSGNTETALYTTHGGSPIIKEETISILSCDSFKTFWIRWNSTSLAFGSGGIIGDGTIIEHFPEPFRATNSVGFGSSNITVVSYELADIGGPTVSVAMPPMAESPQPERMTLTPATNSLNFGIKSCSSGVIRLKKDVDSLPDFEVVLDDNFITKIIKRPEGSDAEVVASVDTYFLLDCNSYRYIWLSWTPTKIRIGLGQVPGMFELLSYTDKDETTMAALTMGSFGPSIQEWRLNFKIDDVYHFYTFSNDYSENPHISVLAVNVVVFRVKACKEAILALSSAPGLTEAATYEVILGHNDNSEVAIRKRPTLEVVASSGVEHLLSCDEFRPFWLRWEGCRLSVGRGLTVGTELFGYNLDQGCHFSSLAFATDDGVNGVWDVNFRELPEPSTLPSSPSPPSTSTASSSSGPGSSSISPSNFPGQPVDHGGLNGGQIAGIVIGVLLGLTLIVALALLYRNHTKRKYLEGGNIVRFSNTGNHDHHDSAESSNQQSDHRLNFGMMFIDSPSNFTVEEDDEDTIRSFPAFDERLSGITREDSSA